jgi:hypothetical protein
MMQISGERGYLESLGLLSELAPGVPLTSLGLSLFINSSMCVMRSGRKYVLRIVCNRA